MRSLWLIGIMGICFLTTALSLKICAFNVQSFGEAKAKNKKVMRILTKIISRCDLSLIQEVRDAKGQAVPALLKNLNRKDVLQVQEQAYYYELKRTKFNNTATFSREPFIIKINSPTTFVKSFIIIGHHSCPRKAMNELEELFEVLQAVKKKWKTENMMLLGDLNADCGYITVKGLKKLKLRNDPKFLWLITDEQDTTVQIDTDFEHVHDEGTNTSQIPLDMAEDIEDMIGASKLWTSDQGLVETLTTVNEQKVGEASSDTSESESSSSINTESTSCLSQEMDFDQSVNTIMAETQQPGECIAEEGNMHTDLEAGVSDKKLTEEEHMNTVKSEYAPEMLPPKSSTSRTFEEASFELDEEMLENYSTAENSSRCESLGNKNEWLNATSPRDDMKEFTEEDQEEIKESLADYPSDLSNSETEEPSENAEAQLFTVDISSSVDHSADKMEEFSNADSPDLNYNSGIKIMEDNFKSADMDLSFQKGTSAGTNVQEYLTDTSYTAEYSAEYKEDAGDLSDLNNPAEDTRDSRCDDTISSQEENNFISRFMQIKKENNVIQHKISTEDEIDDDLGYICKNSDNSPEKKVKEYNTESIQSDTVIKNNDISSDATEMTKNTITEVLWSSSLLMDEDNLRLEEYDWDLPADETFMIHLGEGENQEYTEEAVGKLDIDNDDDDDDDDDEGNKRDWEQEKTRIEAFYRFYSDQAEPEVKVERNHKVSFHLDKESSSSECYEDSDSTEEELDSDHNTPDLNILKPEYHSESDEDPLEMPYYTDRSKMPLKKQEPVNASVKQPPYRNKCLAVLKSMLAFGLLTTIGIVSFWWASENMA
ncbi:Deoxyribonuclease gamma [Bagarius yarrelli]|uniref:Deoxyribonuclease gamma n=1 Tax=Bagarius yarrelli TaxID=175774 RepID=A0A556U7Y8_BAGYA|nr:Deoxyribonuclease gamma [Bagarius yarrelli]